MHEKIYSLICAGLFFLLAASVNGQSPPQKKATLAEDCLQPSAYAELNINNVRARILAGGDMWWDLQGDAQYFIPKNTEKVSLFSGALWIGGLDDNGQLRLAAQRYRQMGADYFPGPLTNDGLATTEASVCHEWDRLFVITKAEVEDFVFAYAVNPSLTGYTVPSGIINYPAHGDPAKGQSFYLAPFYDANGDGIYNYAHGDYPYYDFYNELCRNNLPCGTPPQATMEGNGLLADQVLKGDQTIWWVFNDKGNIHVETGGTPIGLEIRAQAYAYATDDELNNATFYSYEIINRSSQRLNQAWLGLYVDCELGYPYDDYVGCDVGRGLGYCYNGDDIDGNGQPEAYGEQPPAVGSVFYQGPYMMPDGLDNPKYDGGGNQLCDESINGQNFGDCIVDNERLGMQVFSSNYAAGPGMPDPTAEDYYYMLRAIWWDGQHLRYWGCGHPNCGGYGPECTFMFPGDSDPCNWGTGGVDPGITGFPWTEPQAGNMPDDRRYLQSAGPFTLDPGGVNHVIVGIPWARASSGGPLASVELLKLVTDKIQMKFDNCFKTLDGPDAPDVAIQELDRELIIYLHNSKGISNNYNTTPEDYAEVDPDIVFPENVPPDQRGDSAFRFEGYQIFQLRDAYVKPDELGDPDRARLVAQCDIKNGVGKIVNSYYDPEMNRFISVEEVDGADAGIVHSFRVLEDQFATGDKRLVNFKQYYYMAVAYAYNNYKNYDPLDPLAVDGQKLPYKAGRKSATGAIMVQTGIPHKSSPESGGTILHSAYGVQPMITRIEGQGNGGLVVDLTQESVDEILQNGFAHEIEYEYNRGPVNIRVIDPLRVSGARYTLKFNFPQNGSGDLKYATWTLENSDNGQTWNADKTIEVGNEQLIPEIGLGVFIEQVKYPFEEESVNKGFLEATIEFADPSKPWLSGIFDNDANPCWNWIRSGVFEDANFHWLNDFSQGEDFYDPEEIYEQIFEGSWAPYALCSYSTPGTQSKYGPAYKRIVGQFGNNLAMLNKIASVDLVITSDVSKWSRAPVLEMCEDEDYLLSEGQVYKLDMRAGSTDGGQGMGWFPGYAINVETGERLNIAFGEDSWLQGENGRDMKWNPTVNHQTWDGKPLMGGKHWIYVFGHYGDSVTPLYGEINCPAYDEGQWIKEKLQATIDHDKQKQYVLRDCMWVGGPMLAGPEYAFSDPANIPCDVKIRIRVARPYQRYYSSKGTGSPDPVNSDLPMYAFSTYDIAPENDHPQAAEGALQLINVVPNPYYSWSEYENYSPDSKVRITNLPEKCRVTIYTFDGKMVRPFDKDDPLTFINWDLKNSSGQPIVGGIYLIHIKVEGVGEKVLKWCGSTRPLDLNAF